MDGSIIQMSAIGNDQLVEYGIQDEKVDVRFHVSVVNKCVYIFEPHYARERIDRGDLKAIPIPRWIDYGSKEQPDLRRVVTAIGYAVPLLDIPHRAIPIPEDIFKEANFFEGSSDTSVKGKKAHKVVEQMLSRNLLSYVITVEGVTDIEKQIKGQDIVIKHAETAQVKCDWKAGPGPLGTGNLFIQTAECNPLGEH